MCANAHLDVTTFVDDEMIQSIIDVNKKVVVQCISSILVHSWVTSALLKTSTLLPNMFPFLKFLPPHLFFPFTIF